MIPDFPSEDNLLLVDARGGVPHRGHWMWCEDVLIDVFLPLLGFAPIGVYCALARYAGKETHTCWPSIERLARDLGTTPVDIMEQLGILESHGLIRMKVRYRARGQYPSYLFTLVSLRVLAQSLSQPSSSLPLTDYGRKLRDPRWQKKRLEVFTLDHWQCQNCGDTTQTLQVHHHTYRRGVDPWDYPLETLATLCEPCHEALTQAAKRLQQGASS